MAEDSSNEYNNANDQYKSLTQEVINQYQDLKRATVIFGNISKYVVGDPTSEGNKDKKTPFPNEMVIDDDGILWMLTINAETGHIVPVSVMKQMYDALLGLDQSNILQNAEGFLLNSRIHNFYFDISKMNVKLNPSLTFESMYCYYAIREVAQNSDGSYKYLTGSKIIDPVSNKVTIIGGLISFLSKSGSSDELKYSGTGSILEPLEQGKSYVVEFYSNDKLLIGHDIYQAISVKSAESLLSTDMYIKELIVTPLSSVGSNNDACYINQHGDPHSLVFDVRLKFADGTSLDINEHQMTTGRLEILGLDSLDVTKVTTSEEDVQEIEFVYYAGATNSNQEDGELEDGTVLDDLTFSKKIKVYVHENIYDEVLKVIPAGWITTPSANISQEILLKVYAIYASGSMADITNQMNSSERFSCINAVYTYDLSRNAMIAPQQYIGAIAQSITTQVPSGSGNALKPVSFTLATSVSNREFVINGNANKKIDFSPSTHKMKFTGISSVTTLIEANTIEIKGITHIPTHATIRSALDPAIVLAEIELISMDPSVGFLYSSVIDASLRGEYPLLVEFVKKVKDDTTGVTLSLTTTNAVNYYCRQI